jgi:hypothetical protein
MTLCMSSQVPKAEFKDFLFLSIFHPLLLMDLGLIWCLVGMFQGVESPPDSITDYDRLWGFHDPGILFYGSGFPSFCPTKQTSGMSIRRGCDNTSCCSNNHCCNNANSCSRPFDLGKWIDCFVSRAGGLRPSSTPVDKKCIGAPEFYKEPYYYHFTVQTSYNEIQGTNLFISL